MDHKRYLLSHSQLKFQLSSGTLSKTLSAIPCSSTGHNYLPVWCLADRSFRFVKSPSSSVIADEL